MRDACPVARNVEPVIRLEIGDVKCASAIYRCVCISVYLCARVCIYVCFINCERGPAIHSALKYFCRGISRGFAEELSNAS